jgi:hypothetical protein
MEAIITSETSVNFYQTTRRNITEDSHLHTRRRENLKSYKTLIFEVNFQFQIVKVFRTFGSVSQCMKKISVHPNDSSCITGSDLGNKQDIYCKSELAVLKFIVNNFSMIPSIYNTAWGQSVF